jgi:hypothetical protein
MVVWVNSSGHSGEFFVDAVAAWQNDNDQVHPQISIVLLVSSGCHFSDTDPMLVEPFQLYCLHLTEVCPLDPGWKDNCVKIIGKQYETR